MSVAQKGQGPTDSDPSGTELCQNLGSAAIQTSTDSSIASSEDPWQVSGDDPWKDWQGASKVPRRSAADSQQLDVLATQIEKQVMAKVASMMPASGEDSHMSDSSKVQQLETRLDRLEKDVSSQHAQQQARNHEVDHQFKQIRSQVEAHGVNIPAHVDKKFQEQLAQIEGLLTRQSMRE